MAKKKRDRNGKAMFSLKTLKGTSSLGMVNRREKFSFLVSVLSKFMLLTLRIFKSTFVSKKRGLALVYHLDELEVF